jgi:hypothetical protein
MAFSVRERSMTDANLEAMSETNPATAPRKNVGAVACEKIWDNRCVSGMNSNIVESVYPVGSCMDAPIGASIHVATCRVLTIWDDKNCSKSYALTTARQRHNRKLEENEYFLTGPKP